MDGDTVKIACPFTQLSRDRKYKEQILKQIITDICALLNTRGGTLELCDVEKPEEPIPATVVSTLIRILEQSIIPIAGIQVIVCKIKFFVKVRKIIIEVKKADFLVTISYNLYLPSETQVIQVSHNEGMEIIKDAMNRKCVHARTVELGSHSKTFIRSEVSDERENKSTRIKFLKATATKHTKLSDRITGKSNKLTYYVSAFANHSGGHVYFGITEDGIVEGELIPNEDDINDITKKVEKTLNKMIWPEEIGLPKRGVHWDIFFQQVLDENSNSIPSTFVIVIYIAPCLGGVFTEEPECYEMVKGEVNRMSFVSWKRRILYSRFHITSEKDIPATVQRITWSSRATERRCTKIDEVLMEAINNGDWEKFAKIANIFEERFASDVEIALVVLSKKITMNYRRGCFKASKKLLEDYRELFLQTNDRMIFELILMYLEAALARVKGNFVEVRKILHEALSKAESIPPGLLTALVYLFAASINGLSDKCPTPDEFSLKALEHLKHAPVSSKIRIEMEQKAYIILAKYNLGYISSDWCKIHVDGSSFETAKSSIMTLNESAYNGNLLSRYRAIQFNLVQSCLYYRYSEVESENVQEYLREAFRYSEKAKLLARKLNFEEMVDLSETASALCTEALVRAAFKASFNKKRNPIDDLVKYVESE